MYNDAAGSARDNVISVCQASCSQGRYFFVISPAYPTVALPKSALWFAPHKTNYVFDHAIALQGYDVQVDRSKAKLILYWQALRCPEANYSAFVQLIDPSDRPTAQDDRVRGRAQGHAPQAWLPEDLVADERDFDLSSLPTRVVRFRISLYARQIGDRLPFLSNGQSLGNTLVIDQAVTW
jgi:hypothetical protein